MKSKALAFLAALMLVVAAAALQGCFEDRYAGPGYGYPATVYEYPGYAYAPGPPVYYGYYDNDHESRAPRRDRDDHGHAEHHHLGGNEHHGGHH